VFFKSLNVFTQLFDSVGNAPDPEENQEEEATEAAAAAVAEGGEAKADGTDAAAAVATTEVAVSEDQAKKKSEEPAEDKGAANGGGGDGVKKEDVEIRVSSGKINDDKNLVVPAERKNSVLQSEPRKGSAFRPVTASKKQPDPE
jgi:hypothetical protein